MKKNIKNLKQTHGKDETVKTAPRTLNEVWGDTGDKYGTRDPEIYQAQLAEMNKSELQEKATRVGLIPIDDRRILTKRLMDEFKRYVNAYNIPERIQSGTEIPKAVKDILAEGR